MSHPILERLASEDPEERRTACLDAAEDPSAVLLIDALGTALDDPVPAVARAASDGLARIGREHGGVEGVLRAALRGDSPRRRWGAAFTSARLSPPDTRLLPALLEAMGGEDSAIRWSAAKLLVETGRLHQEVVPIVQGLVQGHDDPEVRRMAIFCLRELAPDLQETADTLIAATHDPDLAVRRSSLTALAALLDPPSAVTIRLREVAGGEADPGSRRLATRALEQLARDGARADSSKSSASSEAAPGPSSRKTKQMAARLMVYSAPGGSLVIR